MLMFVDKNESATLTCVVLRVRAQKLSPAIVSGYIDRRVRWKHSDQQVFTHESVLKHQLIRAPVGGLDGPAAALNSGV